MVEIRVFSTKRYDRDGFERANEAHGHAVTFLEPRRHAVATTTLDNITAVVNGDDCPNVVPNTSRAGRRWWGQPHHEQAGGPW